MRVCDTSVTTRTEILAIEPKIIRTFFRVSLDLPSIANIVAKHYILFEGKHSTLTTCGIPIFRIDPQTKHQQILKLRLPPNNFWPEFQTISAKTSIRMPKLCVGVGWCYSARPIKAEFDPCFEVFLKKWQQNKYQTVIDDNEKPNPIVGMQISRWLWFFIVISLSCA